MVLDTKSSCLWLCSSTMKNVLEPLLPLKTKPKLA
jgi:hypothetical protein